MTDLSGIITGIAPCCGGDVWLVEDGMDLPKAIPHKCDDCGAKLWTISSRVNPMTFTEAEFLELYDVDEGRKTVTLKTEEAAG